MLPSKITAGLTLDRLLTLTAYPASAWSMSVIMRGPASINLDAEADGEQHRVHADAATTASWTPGRYAYSIRVTDGVAIAEVDSGEINVKPDLAQATDGHDARGHAQKVLDAIEAVLERRATLDQERYRINNRELYRTPIADLLKLRDRYKAEVARMKVAASGDASSFFGRTVRVSFRGAT